MGAGDLLLLSSALLFSVLPHAPQRMQQLLISELIAPMARSSPDSPIVRAAAALEAAVPEPQWLGELTPEQRCVIGLDDPALRSDGSSVWLEQPTAEPLVGARGVRGNDPMAKELWFFDLTGYLVL